MTRVGVVKIHSTTAEDTEELGARLARSRPQGHPLAVLYLTGDLGAGKTTLARGFLRALGLEGRVRSPTYTLMEVYELGSVTALHLDLYRLRDPSELENLGLREWARPGHLWLVEWPDKGGNELPPPALTVELSAGQGGHDIQVLARSEFGERWLALF